MNVVIEIEVRQRAHIVWLGNQVAIFSGYNVKEAIGSKLPEMKRIRGLFFKFGLEHGMVGKLMGEYVGTKNPNTPSRIRSEFTQSFKKTPENKELYYRFKEFVNREPDTQN